MRRNFIVFSSLIGVSISCSFEHSLHNLMQENNNVYSIKEFKDVNPKEKVIFEGFDEVVKNGEVDEIKNYIAKSSERSIDLTIKFEDDYVENVDRPPLGASMEEVNLAIRRKRQEVKKFFSKQNRKKLNGLKLKKIKKCFISNYSPYVDLTVSKSDFIENNFCVLNELANNDDVDAVYVKDYDSLTNESNMESALPTVGLPKPADIPSFPYSGNGVNIGILEAKGVFDKTNPNFAGTTAEARDAWYFSESISEHATRVASIVGGTSGIARGANIYCDELSGNPKNEVEWMLDKDCNIITNSWSETDASKTGNYKSNSAYFDYICRINWCTICASAGNAGNSNGFVGNPGLGYNVITVGASYDGDTLRSSSSYKESFGISKPTLVAPGSYIDVPNLAGSHVDPVDGLTHYDNCGTSFATPIVAASIALLMEQYPYLKTYPETIISLLTATAKKMSNTYSDFDSSGLEDKVGAGKFNYSTVKKAIYKTFDFSNESNETKRYITSSEVHFTKGKTLRVSLAWLVDSNNKTDTDIVTDYDLHIFNSKGVRIAGSQSSFNNIELVECTIPESDNYTIKVYQYGPKKGKRKDYGTITYYSY